MKQVDLIGNSGIQFVDVPVRAGDGTPALKAVTEFCEFTHDGEVEIRFAHLDGESNQYTDVFSDAPLIDPRTQEPVRHSEIVSVNGRRALECFEGVWLPAPYLRRNPPAAQQAFDGGPIGWARMSVHPVRSGMRDDEISHRLVLAFDTHCTDKGAADDFSPNQDDLSNVSSSAFEMAHTPRDIVTLLSEEWVQRWLRILFERRQDRLGILASDEFHLAHLPIYVAFLELLEKGAELPTIRLHDEDESVQKPLDVDLVLDVGNSRSSGILVQSSEGEPTSFNKDVSRLEIRDLSQPDVIYDDAFEMHVEYTKADFGPEEAVNLSGGRTFDWPSPVRIGPEAVRRSILAASSQYATGMSSPKRYLWDDEPRDRDEAWRFNDDSRQVPKPALTNFLTRHFASDGAFRRNDAGTPGATQPLFSRRSVMTFVFIEIMLHALSQINSYRFREHHGKPHRRRTLRRVVVTCPTAMLQREKVALRGHAEQAAEAISTHLGERIPFRRGIRVVPTAEDTAATHRQRGEWGFDEATCVQLAFLYGEIHSRFGGHVEEFTELYGRHRESSGSDVKSVRVASLDIGGGTSDLMICTYTYDPNSPVPVIRPEPEFWEGFNLAGDDILKKVIERCVIPPIGEAARKFGATDGSADPTSDTVSLRVLNELFGEDYGEQSATERLRRQLAANQVALPIALEMIRHAADRRDQEVREYASFFEARPRPLPEVESHIEERVARAGGAGFRLEDMSWTLDYRAVEAVVGQVMQSQLAALSSIMAQFNCDLLILGGRPTLLPVVRDILVTHTPVPPDRMIGLGRYRIGNWYPFSDARGMIHDPKTSVAVGAAVALLGGTLNRLENFRIDTTALQQRIQSTARYIGPVDPGRMVLDSVVFAPGEEQSFGEFRFYGDMLLGMRQLKDENWIASPMYKLRVRPSRSGEDSTLTKAEQLKHRMPLTVRLRRNPNTPELDPESAIASVHDADERPVSQEAIELKPQTLAKTAGHWLDTGSFFLPRV